MARDLIAQFDLRQKQVLEIGSGQGDFLRLLCQLGPNQGYGFDPSFGPRSEPAGQGNIEFVRGYFGPENLDLAFDLVVCRHVLEHLATPQDLLALIRQVNAPVFFEVPNALYTLRDLGIWDLIYEHPSYFTPTSLRQVFNRQNFVQTQIAATYSDQFLTLKGQPGWPGAGLAPSPDEMAHMKTLVSAFEREYGRKVAAWQTRLRRYAQTGQRVVVWGAGSKGVTFLNVFKTHSQIQAIVDINPRKVGKFIPGSGHIIVNPETLVEIQPAVVILMNSVYENEIRATLSGLNLSPQIMLT